MAKLYFNDNAALLASIQLPDLSWMNNFATHVQEITLRSQRLNAALIEPVLQMKKTMGALASMACFWELPTSKQAVVADPEIKTVEKLKENHLLPKQVLVFSEGKFLLYSKAIKIQKIDSQHYLLLQSLIDLQDSEGLCTYEKIEDFFRSKGLAPLVGDKMRKRIRNALQTAQRFYNLPEFISSGSCFIKVREGKGLIIRNNIRT